jgi:hypothetical protein
VIKKVTIDHALRLRSLWFAWFLCMLFHVQLGLMPLFHGQSPQIESQLPLKWLPMLYWSMLIYFLIPLVAVLLIAYAASNEVTPQRWRPWRRGHFWLSVVYTVTNIPHLLADILVPDSRADQVLLMLFMVILGLLINLEGWRWWRGA